MDPISEITTEREKARGLCDPNVNVCFLATVTSQGNPTVRALSLRDIDHRGFGVLITTLSKKWDELHQPSGYELLLYWPTVHRQFRVQGSVAPMEKEELERYWSNKSRGARLLEHYYPNFEPQSTPIPSREHLVQGIAWLRRKYPEQEDVPLPEVLKGIHLVPHRIETWRTGPDRLHDRRLYTKEGGSWKMQLLVP